MPEREDQLVGEFPSLPIQERAQQKRKALVESGHTLFMSKGYDQTTAKEIAANAGVATGTFYRYFSDKRQLLMSLLEDQIDELLPPQPNWGTANSESLLACLLETHDKRLKELGLSRVLPELLPKDSELADVFANARKNIHAKILKGLIKAREKELTWHDVDLDTIAWSMMLIAENLPKKEEQSGKSADYHEVAKVICRMIFPPEVINKLKSEETGNRDTK